MSISLYQISVPVFSRFLGNLTSIVYRASTHAVSKNVEASAFLQARLFPDMFPLARQIQRSADIAVTAIAKVAGVEVPSFTSGATPVNFAEAVAHLQKATEFLATIKPEQIDGKELQRLLVPRRDKTVEWQVDDYLLRNAIPNFYFHLTTAYGILRHNGIEVGKQDFLGR